MSVGVASARLGTPPRVRRVVFIVATVAAALAFVALRMDDPLPFSAFEGACERLRASGLPITERDWFCFQA
jgi:hypothetical protein